ncbi:MAG: hypothetical protein BAJALOKI3v1_160029 [Promethearchaeota archaeon]|jgi:hypothetical protein|nr:MAG: hypothetical protein BAJALOKI3v1_160029 [Candidatus Lokiarchaeota archaeon]
MIIETILLTIAILSTTVGFFYLIINFRKISAQKVEETEEDELPHDISRAFGFVLLAFLFLTLLSIFIALR